MLNQAYTKYNDFIEYSLLWFLVGFNKHYGEEDGGDFVLFICI
jgi:hypothetical protein